MSDTNRIELAWGDASPPIMTKVFISYSHDSHEHSDCVLQFSNALRSHGIDVELDRYHTRPPKGWPHWCEEQLRPENSSFVLLICTETYLKRVQDKVPADEGRGVFWEGSIIYDYLYDGKGNTRFIPILFSDGDVEFIPLPIRNHTRYCIEAFEFADDGYEDLYRELTNQPRAPKPPLGERVIFGVGTTSKAKSLDPLPVKTDFPSVDIASLRAPQIDISRIDQYAPTELIGRDAELATLDGAWAQAVAGESKRPHILTFVALGGEGKTSLVAKWLANQAFNGWPNCEAAFAWSFYSQGIRDQAAASSDLFLKEALTFFGDEETANSSKHATEKAKRLAQLVAQKRTLLILDGLEPLQYPPGPPHDGRLKDDALSSLLKFLASNNTAGLCIVTTRCSISDLKNYRQTTAPEIELKRLSGETGVALLRHLQVRGTEPEFKRLVEDVKGHALTLNLLGAYLRDAHAGDIRKRDMVKLEEADAEEQSGHAFRVMDSYVQWLETKPENRSLTAILRLLGLFDRPATADCLAALWHAPPIAGLTEPLLNLSEAQRNLALKRLEGMKLLTVNRTSATNLISLDAHPLVREYSARELRDKSPDAWRAAHRRLYEHLCTTTSDRKPEPTLEDLQPLYQAVTHGCHAELFEDAFDKVFNDRILRSGRGDNYSWKKLGAFSSDLEALASFFETPFDRLKPGVGPRGGRIICQAGLGLCLLGRLNEAQAVLQSGISAQVKLKEWESAAIAAGNLSETYALLGKIGECVAGAEYALWLVESYNHASQRDRSEKSHWHATVRQWCAFALCMAGRSVGAKFALRDEAINLPSPEIEFFFGHFWYYDQLLNKASRRFASRKQWPCLPKLLDPVVGRVNDLIEVFEGKNALDEVLARLIHSRAKALQLLSQEKPIDDTTRAFFDEAIRKLRSCAGPYLIVGYLYRAALSRLCFAQTGNESEMQQAKKDLADADAAPGCQEVQIWPIEVLLERARLAIACYNSERRDLDEGTSKKALQYLSEAEQILEKTMERVSQTEQRYKPLIQNWADVPRPKYLVAFSRATDVGYHRHNDEIEDLKTFIEQERMSD